MMIVVMHFAVIAVMQVAACLCSEPNTAAVAAASGLGSVSEDAETNDAVQHKRKKTPVSSGTRFIDATCCTFPQQLHCTVLHYSIATSIIECLPNVLVR